MSTMYAKCNWMLSLALDENGEPCKYMAKAESQQEVLDDMSSHVLKSAQHRPCRSAQQHKSGYSNRTNEAAGHPPARGPLTLVDAIYDIHLKAARHYAWPHGGGLSTSSGIRGCRS